MSTPLFLFRNYKFIAVDLSKQQTLNADPKEIQQISFTGNPSRQGNSGTKMFLIIKEATETISLSCEISLL